MKKLICKILLTVDIVSYLVLSVCALFIRKYNLAAGTISDGFGRILSKAPFFLRSFAYIEDWAGIKWFTIDFVVSFIMLIAGCVLVQSIRENK